MKRLSCLAATLAFCAVTQPAADAASTDGPEVAHAAVFQSRARPIVVDTGFIQVRASGARGQVGACANQAAMRGMEAKTAGASYAVQDRVLELAFVLCMSGTRG